MKINKNRLPEILNDLLARVTSALYDTGLCYPSFTVEPMEEHSSWMKDLPDSMRLNEISIPGTHDAATQYVAHPYAHQDQKYSIMDQLCAGFRALDLRVYVHSGRTKNSLCLCHSISDCRTGRSPFAARLKLSAIARDTHAFLSAHPSETVLFMLKKERGHDRTSEVEYLVDRMVKQHPSWWLLTDHLPTLDEARGKIVLLRRYSDPLNLCTASGLYVDWVDQGDPQVLLNPAVLESGKNQLTLFIQDRFHYAPDDKWRAFCQTLEKTVSDRSVLTFNYLSTAGTDSIPHPSAYAADLNARFLCHHLRKQNTGVLFFDFGDGALAKHVFQTNF